MIYCILLFVLPSNTSLHCPFKLTYCPFDFFVDFDTVYICSGSGA